MTLGTYILDETEVRDAQRMKTMLGRNKRKEQGRLCHGSSYNKKNVRQLDTIEARVIE